MSNLLSFVFTSHLSGYDADTCSWFLLKKMRAEKVSRFYSVTIMTHFHGIVTMYRHFAGKLRGSKSGEEWKVLDTRCDFCVARKTQTNENKPIQSQFSDENETSRPRASAQEFIHMQIYFDTKNVICVCAPVCV